MKSLISIFKSFFRREHGVTAIEYAVVLAGVAIITIAAFNSDGPVKQALDNVFQQLQFRLNMLWNK
ncbi:MAG: Flp family type IVb pilin [Candidatus Schmidhempelia sp.]|nr:Flp family type IVb pilin [Candidatus Schmidhempelia sp.]